MVNCHRQRLLTCSCLACRASSFSETNLAVSCLKLQSWHYPVETHSRPTFWQNDDPQWSSIQLIPSSPPTTRDPYNASFVYMAEAGPGTEDPSLEPRIELIAWESRPVAQGRLQSWPLETDTRHQRGPQVWSALASPKNPSSWSRDPEGWDQLGSSWSRKNIFDSCKAIVRQCPVTWVAGRSMT